MPASQGRAPEASHIAAAIENPGMKMGRNQNGFHSWVTPYSSRL
jgi:hypothetical protein